MKKIASITLIMTLLFLLIPGVVFASDSDIVTKRVNKTNEIIDKMIDNTVKQVDKLESVLQEDIAVGVIDKLIDNLINRTNILAGKTIEQAARQGVEVYCELVEVEIGGQVILIDPLRIGGY